MSEILVLGGTGKTGRRLVRQLTEAGQSARAAARHGAVRFDWDDPASHGPALAGADAVYIVPPALRNDYVPEVETFLAQAKEAGVRRVVHLSARGADAGPAPEQNPLYATEQIVAQSGLEWTVVRPSWFMQNFSEGFFAPDAHGVIAVPAGDGAVPFVDAEDIAAVAAAALTQDGHDGQIYELGGPELLTHAQVAQILGAASGRELRYVDADPEPWQAGLQQAGVPAQYAGMLAFIFGFIREGYEARPSDGIQRALGRDGGSLRAFAEREFAAAPVATG